VLDHVASGVRFLTHPTPPGMSVCWHLAPSRGRIINRFAAMEHLTQFELRLADRMSRLGTETAFEVLNRARQLER